MTTISHSTTVGIKLGPSYTSPVLIDAGVTITNPGFPTVIYTRTSSAASYVIQNGGTISGGAGSAVIDVFLAAGGSVTNAVAGSIYALFGGGVQISGGTGTVINDGSITTYEFGVLVQGGAGVVVNSGTIEAVGYHGLGIGVELQSGGSVTNLATGYIFGASGGISIAGVATVYNDGKMGGVALASGGAIHNAGSGLIAGVAIEGAAGTVVNYGRIISIGTQGLDTIVYGTGVLLGAGGSITNATGSTIDGDISISGGAGTVVNNGELRGKVAVSLGGGGSVTNSASGSIVGVNANSPSDARGVDLAAGGSLTNAGTIDGFIGVVLAGGSTLGNAGTIDGFLGVGLGGGTLTNAGTIIGSGGTAVEALGTYNNLLALDPGFDFAGEVVGSPTGSDTLELASAVSAGTVTGLGSEFVNFGSIAFDAGARWFASGLQRGLAGPISGFALGDTIELTGGTATRSSFVSGVLTLDLAGGGAATLDLPGTFTSASDFVVDNVAAGADVTVACFVVGTRILTAAGEIPVEQLRVDDRVATVSGTLARIRWASHQCAKVSPVRVHAGAFGERLTMRDLLLSPDHAVFVDGALVPICHLINGSTIVQEPADEVTYYHVELATHDVIIAEGLPCESYLDTGNRVAFEDGATATHQSKKRVTGARVGVSRVRVVDVGGEDSR